MGSSISKDGIITAKAVEIITIPTDPSEDKIGDYLWVSIHSSHSRELIELQEKHWIITMKQDKSNGYFWLRKQRIK